MEATIEYVVWGVPAGSKDEDILFATPGGKPITERVVALRLAKLAESKGATSIRIQRVDLSTPPKFI